MTLTVTLILKIANLGLCCRRGDSCFTNTPYRFFLLIILLLLFKLWVVRMKNLFHTCINIDCDRFCVGTVKTFEKEVPQTGWFSSWLLLVSLYLHNTFFRDGCGYLIHIFFILLVIPYLFLSHYEYLIIFLKLYRLFLNFKNVWFFYY